MRISPKSFIKKALSFLNGMTSRTDVDNGKKSLGDRIIQAFSSVATVIYPTWTQAAEIRKYLNNDDLYSIVSKRANNAATIPYYGYKVKDENALKQYKKKAWNAIEKNIWGKKAMEDLDDNDPFVKFLDNPFYGCGKYSGWLASYTYYDIAGECFWYKMDRLKYGLNKGIGKLVILNPINVTILLSAEFPQRIVGYEFLYRSETFRFEPDEIVHIKSFNPDWYNGWEWRGLSPIRVLWERLERMKSNIDNSVSQMRNGGVRTIVYDKTPQGIAATNEASVSGQRKGKFERFIKDPRNVGAPFFADGDMDVLQLGSTLVDMDSLNLEKADFIKLCNAYQVSPVLFGNTDASTESNVELQMKMMWTQAILPLVTVFKDAIVKDILPDFGGKDRYVDVDISGVQELQKDLKWQAEALKNMDHITYNEKRVIQKFGEIENENMDKILVDSNKVFLDDLSIDGVEPV